MDQRKVGKHKVDNILSNDNSNNKKEKKLLVFTDPFSDPLCDDHYAVAFLEGYNKHKHVFGTIEYCISAINNNFEDKDTHLNNVYTRAKSIAKIVGDENRISLLSWEIMETRQESRVPFNVQPIDNYVKERTEEENKDPLSKPIFNIIENKAKLTSKVEAFSHIICIGLMSDTILDVLLENLKTDRKPDGNIKEIHLQGPGFNTMGTSKYHPTYPNKTVCMQRFLGLQNVYTSDNASGLLITKKQLAERMIILGEYDNTIEQKNNINNISFFFTADRANQFTGQFGDNEGFQYIKHTTQILKALGRGTISKGKTKLSEQYTGHEHLNDIANIQNANKDISEDDEEKINVENTKILNILKEIAEKHGKDIFSDKQRIIAAVAELKEIAGKFKSYDEINAVFCCVKNDKDFQGEQLASKTGLVVNEKRVIEIADKGNAEESIEKYRKNIETFINFVNSYAKKTSTTTGGKSKPKSKSKPATSGYTSTKKKYRYNNRDCVIYKSTDTKDKKEYVRVKGEYVPKSSLPKKKQPCEVKKQTKKKK
jgi:hypothetical protein